MMKKIVNKFLGFFLGVLLVLSALGFFVLGTQDGLRLGFSVVSKLVPGELSIQQLDGKLTDTVQIQKLYYENDDIKLTINQANFKLKLIDLLYLKFSSPLLHVDGIEINLKKSDSADKPFILSDAIKEVRNAIKVVFSLEDLQLSNLMFQYGGLKQPFIIDKLFVRIEYADGDVGNLKIKLSSKYVDFLVAGSIDERWGIDWKFDFRDISKIHSMALGSVSGSGKVSGKKEAPILDVAINSGGIKYNEISFSKLKIKSHIDSFNLQNSNVGLDIVSPKVNDFALNKLSVAGDVGLNSFGNPKVSIAIDSSALFFPIGDQRHSLKINRIDLVGDLGKNDATVSGKVFLAASDPIDLEINLLNVSEIKDLFRINQQQIKGKVKWQTQDLRFVETTFPQVKNIKGGLGVEFYLNGTLLQPTFLGKSSLNVKKVNFPGLNTSWKNIVLEAKLASEACEYQGEVYSGDGKLALSGKTLILEKGSKFSSQIQVLGSNFLLADNQQYYLVISPKLDLYNSEEVWDLSGDISIPKANLRPNDLQGSDSLPSEIVYAHQKQDQKDQGLNLKMNVQLKLGDEVDIDVMGLKGRVTGQMVINDAPKQTTTATGSLHIKNGIYSIYSQKLQVTQGALNFWGGPIKNPNINMEATRSFKKTGVPSYFVLEDDGLTVGVKVTGMISNPRIDLFSIPPGLSKPDILSYLITGQSSEDLSENKGQLLMQAASMLDFGGAGEASSFVSNLKDNLGFDEFGFSKEDFSTSQTSRISSLGSEDGNSSSQDTTSSNTVFVLGKYLTPKLYVSYSQALLEAVNIFRIRYYMSKYWSVQSESSSDGNSGIDIICSFER